MAFNNFLAKWILRVIGQRVAPSNVVTHNNKTANVVRFAAQINYYNKANKLLFYNNKYNNHKPVKPPPKPRQRPTTNRPSNYKAHIQEQEAAKAYKPIVIKPRNLIRALYYVKKILLVYCAAYKALVAQSDIL